MATEFMGLRMSESHSLHNYDNHGDSHGVFGGHHGNPRPWSRIKQLFLPERSDLLVIVIYACFVALLSLATPIAVEAMVSTVMFGVVIWPIIWLAIILMVCLTLAGVIHAAEAYVIEYLQRRLFVRTVAELSNKLPRVKLESYDREFGPALARIVFSTFSTS
jgi:putative ABC transport system ATP-binding protein